MTRLRNSLLPLAGLSLLLVALLPSTAEAEMEQTILAYDGNPVRVAQAIYGDLDPLGSLAHPGSSVLALQIPRDGETPLLELVPGTEGPEYERRFSLLYDRESESLFVFWESLSPGSTALNLTGRDRDGVWTEVVEISGNPFSSKTSPKLAITHDEAPDPLDGETRPGEPGHRSILHLVWSEARGDGGQALIYSPVALAGGKYLGPNAVYDLEDLAGDESAAEGVTPTSELLESLIVATGGDSHSVALAFADSQTRRLVTLHVEALSPDLVSMADAARSSLDVFGSRETIRRILDVARPTIDVFGQRIHPGVRSFMVQSIEHALVSAADATGRVDPRVAAALVWEEIIRAGASVEDHGLLDEESLRQPRILEVIAREPQEQRAEGSPLLKLRMTSSRPVPQTGDSSQTRMFVSPDGADVIVSWLEEETRLLYVESRDDGWSDVQSLSLGEQMSLRAAYELLERRVR